MNYKKFHEIVTSSEHPDYIEAKALFRKERGWSDKDFMSKEDEVEAFLQGYYEYLKKKQIALKNTDPESYSKGFQEGYWQPWSPRYRDPNTARTPYELGMIDGWNRMITERS